MNKATIFNQFFDTLDFSERFSTTTIGYYWNCYLDNLSRNGEITAFQANFIISSREWARLKAAYKSNSN